MVDEKEATCDCDHLEISQGEPGNCSLNQVIKCHGDMPMKELIPHMCNCGCQEVKKEV